MHEGHKRTYSPTGIPLLHLCIENETISEKFPLKDMLHIILDSGHYDMCCHRHGSPLTVAIDFNCFECIEIMSNDIYKFDF